MQSKKKNYTSFLEPYSDYYNFNSINFYCDFETVLVDDVHYVCCFSIVGPNVCYFKSLTVVNGSNIHSESKKLIFSFIQICSEFKEKFSFIKKTRCLFIFHNFSKFDSFFIIKNLTSDSNFEIDLISRNKTIYRMIISNKLKNLKLEFRDSYLLLNLSLEKIGHIFCNQYKKFKFDHSLNILEIYYSKKLFFDVKKKIEVYCLNDSLLLREGFECFLQEVKKNLSINPLKFLSLPSLATKIFLRDFYDFKNEPIENCSGNKETFIRQSYCGGTTEIFKPYLKNGYHYDINSLYPYVMKEFEYPIGVGLFVKANEINLDTFFGFLEVEVYCPSSIKIPILTNHSEGRGLICPTGNWSGVYFSEELKVAKSLGYQLKIIRGVSYKKGRVFANIISQLYGLRSKYSKNSPSNTILKLLMNSLYGRFGMKPFLPVTRIVDEKQYGLIEKKYDILARTCLNNKIIVVYNLKPVKERIEFSLANDLISSKNSNPTNLRSLNKSSFSPIQIASAITSYARIIIHKYKSDSNNVIYYSDTDSIFCKYPLHKRYVSDSKLGFMKYCGKIKEAYFIAPKLYACIYKHRVEIRAKGVNTGLVSLNDILNFYKGKPQSYINSFPFKKDYKSFIIKKILQKIHISGILKTRNKKYTNGVWTSTSPHNL